MTPLTMLAATCLAVCRFYPGSWAKRYAAEIHERHVKKGKALTPAQHLWLWKLVWQFRGQIKNHDLVREAIRVIGDTDGHKAMLVLIEEVGE